MLNLMSIESGQHLRLKNGDLVEVLENIGDGMWLKARWPNGDEEMVFCEEIACLETAPTA